MDIERFDFETLETVAGVLRLLHRASALAWSGAEAEGFASARQLFALSVDEAVDHARALLSARANLAGPMPVGDDPAGLLQSADQLLLRLITPASPSSLHQLHARVADLAWEASTGAGA